MKYIFSINGRTVTEDEFNKVYCSMGHWFTKGCDYDGTKHTTKYDTEGKRFDFKETPIKK